MRYEKYSQEKDFQSFTAGVSLRVPVSVLTMFRTIILFRSFGEMTSLVAWWSELLTTKHEVPGSIPGSTICAQAGSTVWSSFVSLRCTLGECISVSEEITTSIFRENDVNSQGR